MSGMSDPFSFNAGAVESSYVGNLGEAFRRYGEQDEEVLLISPDLGAGPVTGAFVQQFPERFIDAGIAECNAMSMAAGMATYGYKVFVLQMGAFGALKCAEQIRTDIAFSRVPVRILSAWSGLAMGFFGTTHHALEDIAITRAIPGLTVLAPADDNAASAMLAASEQVAGPVFIRLTDANVNPVYDAPPEVRIGRFGRVRDGSDGTIIGTGLGAQLAVGAADLLAAEGLSIRVLDAYSLKPLDEDAIVLAARETGALLTVEEHLVTGGLGSAVGEVLARNALPTKFSIHGLPDETLTVGMPDELYVHYGLTIEETARRMRVLLAGKC
ncbi:MAG TPA: transketolase [Halieaceae bacterium]|jgi:transketolase|uniref:transketolase family protein n=1 Tax=Haliea TaxID=475794 RepID=UPI0003F6457D|nr:MULTISPECIES: transketolase C-terminal domain-containing protein [Haliea]HAN67379.1 transketolase [Halieaceae bacterium]MAD63311.1 transketolase [Haliea sp.]MAY91848.1 transketolase [Haliea sp.]MBK41772.1 transketolase [Haliea sp.]MBP70363.1 transketolase [Haliea sp.]|tara:strand:- start:7069 stop:8049 length:981 start_codon:yes stop_codon:yes gene_type:complete